MNISKFSQNIISSKISEISAKTNKILKFKGSIKDMTTFSKETLTSFAAGKQFLSWAKKNNFTDNLINIIQDEKNFLGKGGNGTVFKIPHNDDFVIKVPNGILNKISTGQDSTLEVPKSINLIKDNFANYNVGQPVAEIGKLQILKKQEGIAHSVPHGIMRRGGIEADKNYINSLKTLAEFPQSSFDEVAETFAMLNKQGYAFDPSKPGNFLIDAKNKKINLVDLNPTKTPHNALSYMLIPMIDTSYFNSFKKNKVGTEPEFQEINKYASAIVSKCIEAAKKNKLDITTNDVSYPLEIAKYPTKDLPESMKKIALEKELKKKAEAEQMAKSISSDDCW